MRNLAVWEPAPGRHHSENGVSKAGRAGIISGGSEFPVVQGIFVSGNGAESGGDFTLD